MLTFQGNPEFDPQIIMDFAKPILNKDTIDEIRTGDTDHQYATRVILEFLREEPAAEMTGEVVVEEEVAELKSFLASESGRRSGAVWKTKRVYAVDSARGRVG